MAPAHCYSTALVAESIVETCNAVLTFESVAEINWCDHSNETSSGELLHGTICVSVFYKMKFLIFILGTLGSKMVKRLLWNIFYQ